MKKLIFFLISSYLFSGCATVAEYHSSDSNADGTKVSIGTKRGAHIGDKIKVLENQCSEARKGGNRCKITEIGSMTIVKAEEDYSIAKPDGEINLKEGVIFKLDTKK